MTLRQGEQRAPKPARLTPSRVLVDIRLSSGVLAQKPFADQSVGHQRNSQRLEVIDFEVDSALGTHVSLHNNQGAGSIVRCFLGFEKDQSKHTDEFHLTLMPSSPCALLASAASRIWAVIFERYFHLMFFKVNAGMGIALDRPRKLTGKARRFLEVISQAGGIAVLPY